MTGPIRLEDDPRAWIEALDPVRSVLVLKFANFRLRTIRAEQESAQFARAIAITRDEHRAANLVAIGWLIDARITKRV